MPRYNANTNQREEIIMVELNDIRVGTKFRVTWADKYCGVSKGQIVTVDSIYRGCSKDFRRPRIKNGYIIYVYTTH